MTIHYDPASYDLDDQSTWDDLIDPAVRYLGALWDDATECAEYEDSATRRRYRVHPADLAALGARLRDGQPSAIAYSLWCAACPAEEVSS